MNRSQRRTNPLQYAFLSGAIATTATLTVFGPMWCRAVRAAFQDSPKAVIDQTWQIVNREYVDPSFNQTDWQQVRQDLLSREYSSPQQAYVAIREALKKLEDPYTRFLDPKQFEALTDQTSGELSGVGMSLEVQAETRDIVVVEPYQNSPAAQAGIQPGDRILAIDGKSTQGMNVEDAARLIRGRAGTEVMLRLSRPGRENFELKLTRARIELPTVTYSLKQEGPLQIGYIRLDEFSSHAASQMRHSIDELKAQNVNGFVLDLRGNPGGLLQSSIEIARMWLDNGSIVKTVNRGGKSEAVRANRTALTNLPLVVLVDSNSASSSEILTGALQDNQRAKIVGTKTFGKALVQAVHPLSDGSGVAVTVAHYYTPKGTDISQKGITPDVPIELTEQQQQKLAADPKLIGTKEDPQYAKALSTLVAEATPRRLATHSPR
ncbi:MAG: PDZ domain-containing protein [Desertifilum sp. SIO1I2]|nr:PDZ domain-containing protein [Desertifilum sp. SIO1I2]